MDAKRTIAFAGASLLALAALALAAHGAGAQSTAQEQEPANAKSGDDSNPVHETQTDPKKGKQNAMDSLSFGNFSVSLAVKDLQASKAFYEKLDFRQIGGEIELNYVIMQNGTTTIGLFQGMFDKNILTFNPGWNHKAETLDEFQDVRALQAELKERGITPVQKADPATNGPASFVLVDPDGNPILVDQHVPKPG